MKRTVTINNNASEEALSVTESYSGDCDVDPYESEDEEHKGLPEDFAMTSQNLQQNILLSFFPANLYGIASGSDEENKGEEDGQTEKSYITF